ncbi:MAG: NUDIX hydrolase [Chloroflexota bacterium]
MKSPARRPPVTQQHSAGGVVVRCNDGQAEFLAIMPAHRERWQLPKGTIDPGETPPVTAVREVREEGGVQADIVDDLGPIDFYYQMDGGRYHKTVNFYLMRYQSGNPADHDHEIQQARWFALADESMLAFPTERFLINRARQALAKERPA